MRLQTRDSFDAAAVLEQLKAGQEPNQGWQSLLEEASHRLIRSETQLARLRRLIVQSNADLDSMNDKTGH